MPRPDTWDDDTDLRVRRAPWSPNRATTVVLDGCGHITFDWPVISALGSLARKAYCEICEEWYPIWRKATVAESVGIIIEPLPLDVPF